jgi:hypothetical protein
MLSRALRAVPAVGARAKSARSRLPADAAGGLMPNFSFPALLAEWDRAVPRAERELAASLRINSTPTEHRFTIELPGIAPSDVTCRVADDARTVLVTAAAAEGDPPTVSSMRELFKVHLPDDADSSSLTGAVLEFGQLKFRVARQAHVTRDVPISSAKLDAPAAHAANKAALDAPSAAPSDASAPRAAHDKEAAPAPASA